MLRSKALPCVLLTLLGLGGGGPASGVSSEDLLNELVQNEAKNEQSADLIDSVLRIGRVVKLIPWTEMTSEVPKDLLSETLVKHPRWNVLETAEALSVASVNQARSALLPQVSLNANYGRRITGSSPVSDAPRSDLLSSQLQIGLRQLLFDFGSTWRLWKSSEQAALASCLRTEHQRSEFLLEAVEPMQNRQRTELLAYWSSVLLRQRDQTVRMMKGRFEEGAGTIYDISRAELKRAEISRQQADLSGQLTRLTTQIRLNGFRSPPTLPVIWLPAADQEPNGFPGHPLVDEALRSVEAAKLQALAAAGRRFPQLSLDLSAGGQRYEGDRPGTREDYSALVTLSYPLFDGGLSSARADEALARVKQAQLDLDQRLMTLANLESQALSDLGVQTELLLSSKQGLLSALQSLAAAKELFRIKRADLQDLQRAEDELLNEGVRLINSWFDLSISTYRYLHLKGTLMPFLGFQSVSCAETIHH